MIAGGSPTVDRVLKGDLCTGCGLCASVSATIEMQSVAPGYNRPVQRGPTPPNQEAIIAAACPGAVVEPWSITPPPHPYWGPCRQVLTGFATDPEVRFRGSSGGVVTALAVHALQSGLVDRVVHVMPDAMDPAANAVVVSSRSAEVIQGAGSRYVSSSPLKDVERILSDGGTLAFIGKPCDISALRRLARIDSRVDAHVPLMLAFFCAGVPSRSAVGRVISSLGVAPEELATFRYRGEGWPGKATATTHEGRIAQMSYEDSWGGHLSKEVQFRCKICPDAVGGVADIACADAWYGGETGYPTFEELDGRSLVLTRTARGEQHVQSAVAVGNLAVAPLDIGEIDLMQPSQARRKRMIGGRVAALTATLRPYPEMAGLQVEEASRRAGVLEQARNFLGSVRRSLRRGRF